MRTIPKNLMKQSSHLRITIMTITPMIVIQMNQVMIIATTIGEYHDVIKVKLKSFGNEQLDDQHVYDYLQDQRNYLRKYQV